MISGSAPMNHRTARPQIVKPIARSEVLSHDWLKKSRRMPYTSMRIAASAISSGMAMSMKNGAPAQRLNA